MPASPLSCRSLISVSEAADLDVSADCGHSVMQQTPEMVATGPSWCAASQHSAPHPPSPLRCGGRAASELPTTAIKKRIVRSLLTIRDNLTIYSCLHRVVSTSLK